MNELLYLVLKIYVASYLHVLNISTNKTIFIFIEFCSNSYDTLLLFSSNRNIYQALQSDSEKTITLYNGKSCTGT